MDQLREEQRYDREKTAFQDKHRKAIAKQEKKERPKHFSRSRP